MFAPCGYWIILGKELGSDTWYVRVLDFASWKHWQFDFASRDEARTEAGRWML